MDYNLLYRWFLDMNWDEPSFDHSTLSRNRARLLEHDVAGEFFRTVVAEARALKLTSDEHFTVDGTLIEAWASLKSLRPKGEERSDRTPPDDPGHPSVDFHGERRQNATHQSTTDPEARLAKKGAGKEARLCYPESVLMENRNGIVIDLRLGQASGRAEREQGLELLQAVRGARRITKGHFKATSYHACCCHTAKGGISFASPITVPEQQSEASAWARRSTIEKTARQDTEHPNANDRESRPAARWRPMPSSSARVR